MTPGAERRPPPAVSVVVPTRNRCARLLDLLGALREQTYPARLMEVLVVVNGTSDDTMDALARFDAPWALHAIEVPEAGAAAARNRGAGEATGELLLFLDDDVLPVPTLVEAHARAYENGGETAAVGPYYPSHGASRSYFRMHVRNWWEDLYRGIRSPGHRVEYRDLLGGNFSIGRDLFRKVGGFPSDFARCDGEDWELGIRLVRSGVSIRFLPDARAEHRDDVTASLEGSFLRARRSGRGDAIVVRLHPEFSERLGPPPGRWWDLSARRLPILFARTAPVLGDSLVWTLLPALALADLFRMRKGWRNLYHLIRGYWHWRGFFEEERNQARSVRNREGAAPSTRPPAAAADRPGPPRVMKIDLAQGIEAAAAAVDRERPEGLRVVRGDRLIGTIRADPGTESLRGVHLRAALAGPLADALLDAGFGAERKR